MLHLGVYLPPSCVACVSAFRGQRSLCVLLGRMNHTRGSKEIDKTFIRRIGIHPEGNLIQTDHLSRHSVSRLKLLLYRYK